MAQPRFDGVYQRESQNGGYCSFLRFFPNGVVSSATIGGQGATTPADVAQTLTSLPATNDTYAMTGGSMTFKTTTAAGVVAYVGEVLDDQLELRWHSFGKDVRGTYVFVSATALAAGWMRDPFGRHQHRYWDGDTWTAHVADNGSTSSDAPLPSPSSPPSTPPSSPAAARLPDSNSHDDAIARSLLLELLNVTHQGTPLENQEVVDLLEKFQRAAGMPTGTPGSMAFMTALGNGSQQDLCSDPWRWLLAATRRAAGVEDDLFVARAVSWVCAWKNGVEQRFRPLLGVHLVGSIPQALLIEFKQLADMSLTRLPQNQVLFADQTGQVTVSLLADVAARTFG
jgi:Protein of unknown function (DUF2510)